MPNYSAPGVYIEEVQSGARPIQAVGTSTAGFVGVAPVKTAHVQEAVRINNWQQFVKEFMTPSVPVSATTGGVLKNDSEQSVKVQYTDLAKAVYGFYQNCSGVCYVVNIGDANSIDSGMSKERKGIDLFKEIDEIAIVAAPGYTTQDEYGILLKHCEECKDRFAILDPSPEISNVDQMTSTKENVNLAPRQSKGGYGAVYFPNVIVTDICSEQKNVQVKAPPSGHIAGIFARVDAAVGVHKAPANEEIRGAVKLEYNLTLDDCGVLNQAGVNSLRNFPGEGIKVWGARTRADSSSNWRYVNVRRLFNMIEESIAKSTKWVVFEPNDFTLWNAIKRDVSAFLTTQWRKGALKGKTPEEAFYVKCDEETNPPDIINDGMVVTEIGIAPVKPAEFVIFKIGQTENGTQKI